MKLPFDESSSVGRLRVEFGPDIATAILLTMEAGWTRAVESSDVDTSAGEVTMTERLRDGMRSVLDAKQFPWSKELLVAPGTESRSRPGRLVPDGRTDIPIYLIDSVELYGHDPHAIIECKRIAGSSSRLCREYVVEGVDRFKTGKYGENHAIGFMSGYVLAGDCLEAVAGINAYFRRTSRLDESLVASDLVIQEEFWRSRHVRELPRNPVGLHHAFFQIPAAVSRLGLSEEGV